MTTNPNPSNDHSGRNITRVFLRIVLVVGFIVVVTFFLRKGGIPGWAYPEPGLTPPPVDVSTANIDLIELQPDQALEIIRSGQHILHGTDNCLSPVSTFETIKKTREYAVSIELEASESDLEEIGRSVGSQVPSLGQVEAAVQEKIAVELSKQVGVHVGESVQVESSRTIETPAGYSSAVALQWEEAHSIGIAMIKVGEADPINIQFQYVSDMHLAQVGTSYAPCSGAEAPIELVPAANAIVPGTVLDSSLNVTSPVNTECKNPVRFEWNAQPGRKYQAKARYLGDNYVMESNWLEGDYWEADLPAHLWGGWEWYVVSDIGGQSIPATFIFNPFPKENRDIKCSNTIAKALETPARDGIEDEEPGVVLITPRLTPESSNHSDSSISDPASVDSSAGVGNDTPTATISPTIIFLTSPSPVSYPPLPTPILTVMPSPYPAPTEYLPLPTPVITPLPTAESTSYPPSLPQPYP